MSDMSERFRESCVKLGMAILMLIPGAIAIAFMPVAELVHQGGILGAVAIGWGLGFIICIGAWLVNWAVYVITGESMFERVFL